MPKYDWSKYNLIRDKEAIKILKKNLSNKFKVNFIEKGLYNHIRDIYALSISLLHKNEKKINILDLGGNLISNINLINRINTKKILIYVYNPYASNLLLTNKNIKFIRSIKDIKKLNNVSFDLCYFGSTLQYLKNLEDSYIKKIIKRIKLILITHTPISLSNKHYVIKQNNQKRLFQNIFTIDYIKKSFLDNRYKIIFQSINEDKYLGFRKKVKGIYSLNILLRKK